MRVVTAPKRGSDAWIRAESQKIEALEAKEKAFEDELLAAVGGVRVSHDQIGHERFMAIEPALRVARGELGLGRVNVKFFDRPTNAAPRGFTHRDRPKTVWVAIDQLPGDILEACLHELKHLQQIRAGDRRTEAEREAEAVDFGERWGRTFRTEAYRW